MAIDPREKRREGSRRAQAARTKRQEARQKKKNRNIMVGIGGVLAVIVAAVSFAFFSGGGEAPGRAVAAQEAIHYQPDSFPAYQYNTSPPSSGPHYPFWSSWGFLGTPLVVGEVVHSMEHGGVVIWYKPDEAGVLAAQVRDLVRSLGSQCVVAGPYAEMPSTVAATSWGRILELDSFDAEQLREFVNAYRGRLGPEAGLCRTNP